jgi:Spy/CpxP family protein refolding chaperone
MMKRFLVTLAVTAGIVAAQQNTAPDLRAYLGLSDTQASSLRQIRENARKDAAPLRQTIQEKARAIREQNQAGTANATALGQMMIDLQNARKQLAPLRMRAHDQAMAVLTPDQQAKLTQLEAGAKRGKELRQAVRLGLVDRLGGLGQAGNASARRARARKL